MIVRCNTVRAVLAVVIAAGTVVFCSPAAFADSIRDRQWYLSTLDIARVHQLSQGAGVTVGLIDTGVDAKHPDLAGAVLPGLDLHDYKAGDGTGRNDVLGHGTEMAGIIAGRGHGDGHADGILGIAPEAKILPVRVIDNGFLGSGYIGKAIDYAVAHHVGVMNMSFSGDDDTPIRDAIKKAQAADIVLVAGSGNRNQASSGPFPGAFPEVLSVGAVDQTGKIWADSITGPQLDIVAPGVNMASTGIVSTGYSLTTGTSDATAIVSGAAALIRAKYPNLSAAEVMHRLTATATDAGAPGRDDTYGYGRLNLIKALTADVPPATPSTTPSSGTAPATAARTDVTSRSSTNLAMTTIVIGGVLIFGTLISGALVVLVRRRK